MNAPARLRSQRANCRYRFQERDNAGMIDLAFYAKNKDRIDANAEKLPLTEGQTQGTHW